MQNRKIAIKICMITRRTNRRKFLKILLLKSLNLTNNKLLNIKKAVI